MNILRNNLNKDIVTPGGFVDMGDEFEYSAKRELIEEAFGLKKKKNKEEFEKMEEIIGKGELVKFGGAELSQVTEKLISVLRSLIVGE